MSKFDARPAAKAHRTRTGHRLALLTAACSSCRDCDFHLCAVDHADRMAAAEALTPPEAS